MIVNPAEDYLNCIKSTIEISKKREKYLEEKIKEFENDETLKGLLEVNRSYIRALEKIEEGIETEMKNNEMKVVEAIKQEVECMTGLEIINNQISIIIGEINKKVKVDTNSYDVVRLSAELRELVLIRDELEKKEDLKKQREEFKRKLMKGIDNHREEERKF